MLAEVAQAEAERLMVRIEREAAAPPPPPPTPASGGAAEGFVSFDAEAARKVQLALADAQAAARRRARALDAASEASSESDAAHAAAKRAQQAAREMGSGCDALADRERERLDNVKQRLERGREQAEDAIMAMKTAEDAFAAAEAQKADALAVAR